MEKNAIAKNWNIIGEALEQANLKGAFSLLESSQVFSALQGLKPVIQDLVKEEPAKTE